ncbi:hypothetical protein FIBSPDRAFT_1014972, partial [Athelia psychrophila]
MGEKLEVGCAEVPARNNLIHRHPDQEIKDVERRTLGLGLISDVHAKATINHRTDIPGLVLQTSQASRFYMTRWSDSNLLTHPTSSLGSRTGCGVWVSSLKLALALNATTGLAELLLEALLGVVHERQHRLTCNGGCRLEPHFLVLQPEVSLEGIQKKTVMGHRKPKVVLVAACAFSTSELLQVAFI